MVVDTGSNFWKLVNGEWLIRQSFSAENGWVMSVERKTDKNGKIIQYSSYDWWHRGKDPGGAAWNPGGGDGFKGNRSKAWTKGIVGMLTGNEKIMDAAFHGSTDDFLKSTGEGMSDAELAINLAVIGGGIVGGIASSRAGVRSGHAEAGNLKAMRAKYKISKAQVFEEAKQQGKDLSKLEESQVDAFVKEWNARDPVDNLKIADTYLSKEYQDLNTKQRTQMAQKPVWKGGSWDRASAADKSSFTTRWNAWKAGKAALEAQIEKVGARFSRVREAYNRLKAARDRRLAEEAKAKGDAAVKKFERDNNLKELTFMEYLVEFKHIYKKNPTEAELADFKITFNKFRVDLNNVDSAVRETALENYKAAGEADPTSTYFRMWEDIKSKNNGKIDLKTFEDQIKTESLEAFKSARASRIKQFEEQHGLKKMTIEEYIYKYQENNNGYRPNRAQLKKFIADYNDYRVDLNSISESTKAKIMEDYEAGGEKTPNLYEVWEVNKAKGGSAKTFEEALLKDAAQSRRAAEYTEKISKLEGLDKNKDGELTKEEVKEFNKKFDFDADGILGEEEKAAKAAEIEEKYPDLDAEERRLLEDDEVEVDLFGDDPPPPKADATGKAAKAAAGATAAGAVAGAVAAGVEASKKDSVDAPKEDENWRDWDLPASRRRMIEGGILKRLLDVFENKYFYPKDDIFAMERHGRPPDAIVNTQPPFLPDKTNPFDIAANQVPINMEEKTYHPDITKQKVHELLLKTEGAYDEAAPENAVVITNNDFTFNVKVNVYTEAGYKVVAFRGTQMTSGTDWLNDFNTASARLDTYFPFIRNVDNLIGHMGFIRSVAAVYEDVKRELEGVANFEITGHSYAGAMATIFAYVYYLDTFKQPLHAFVFGAPRVFMGDVEKYNKKIDLVRFQNSNDAATFVPTKEVSLTGAAGALIGGAAGYMSRPGNSFTRAAGAIAGAVASSQALGQLPYKHVGLGIMLFREKNEVVNLGSGFMDNKGDRVVPESFLYIPEGQDILRNPIDMRGEIVKASTTYLFGDYIREAFTFKEKPDDPTYQMLFSGYINDNRFGLEFLNKAYGYFQLFLDANKILLQNKYDSKMMERIHRFRRTQLRGQARQPTAAGELLRTDLADTNIPFGTLSAELFTKLQEKVFAATNRFYQLPQIDRSRYTNTGLWVRRFWGDQNEQEEPEYLEYLQEVEDLTNRFFKEQKSRDYFVLRDSFMRFHIYSLSITASQIALLYNMYNKYTGHLLSTYLERIDLLPDVLYSGQNIPEVISDTSIGGGGGGFDTYYKRNPHTPHRNYYDAAGNGFYLDNFNKIQPVNKILGFIFYKDPSVLNQLILY